MLDCEVTLDIQELQDCLVSKDQKDCRETLDQLVQLDWLALLVPLAPQVHRVP